MNRFLSLFGILLLPIIIWAQAPLSLSQAIEKGLAQQYSIKIADQQVAIAEEQLDKSIAGGLPSVNFTTALNSNFNRQVNPAGFLPELSILTGGLTPGVEASMVLYNGHRVQLTMDRLGLSKYLAEADQKAAIEQTIQQISMAYYQAQVLKAQIPIGQTLLNQGRERIRFQEIKKSYGQGATFEILQANESLLSDSISLLQLTLNADNAIRNLSLAMGDTAPTADYMLTDALTLETSVFDLSTLFEQVKAQNPSLQRAILNQQLADKQIESVHLNRMPSLSVRAGGSYSLNNNIWGTGTTREGMNLDLGGLNSNSQNGFVGLNLVVPIYDGGARQRQEEVARKQAIVAQLSVEQAQQTLYNQLQNTWYQYKNQQSIVELLTQRLAASQQSLQIAETQLRNGQISSIDYRTVQIGLLNANQQYLNSLMAVKTAALDIYRLTGQMATMAK